jgi:hypothetical protein
MLGVEAVWAPPGVKFQPAPGLGWWVWAHREGGPCWQYSLPVALAWVERVSVQIEMKPCSIASGCGGIKMWWWCIGDGGARARLQVGARNRRGAVESANQWLSN